MEEELERTEATTTLNITVECPYCTKYMFVTDDLIESLECGKLSADDIEEVLTCDNDECGRRFIVETIYY